MSDAEHERTLSHLDPEFREALEDHWKTLDHAQDIEDQMMSATIDTYNKRTIKKRATKPTVGSVRKKLNAMIDRILGIPKD